MVEYALILVLVAVVVIALVLAIASWVGWGLCPIIGPLALAIVALVLASNALKEIRAGGGRVTGEGLVTAARIVACCMAH